MSSLDDLPELVGFFSYSREDDADSHGALSELRTRIQGGLRGLLGRTAKTFRLWQDKEAIASGTLWETEIKNAVAQSVFFIPIITPTVIASPYCRFELESFLAREGELGRDDLVFPILYIDVPALQDAAKRQNDPVLSLLARRQYVDWREFQYLDIGSTDVRREVGRFCTHIRDALNRPWLSPNERKQQEETAARREAEAERQRAAAEATRRAEDEARQLAADEEKREREAGAERNRIAALEAKARDDEERRKRQTEAEQQKVEQQRLREEAETKRRVEAEERRQLRRSQSRPLWPPSLAALANRPTIRRFGLAYLALVGVVALGIIGLWLASPARIAKAPTPALPGSPPIDAASCEDELCGTTWTYTDQGGDPNYHNCPLLFKAKSEVSECGSPGTYEVHGNSVQFSVNNNYAQYQATISGTQMSGTAKNINNYSWTWSALKQ